MKIYQVHEYSGIYEDFVDKIEATFIHEENAINFINKCMENEAKTRERYKWCMDCKYDKDCFKYDDNALCGNEIVFHEDREYGIKVLDILDWGD